MRPPCALAAAAALLLIFGVGSGDQIVDAGFGASSVGRHAKVWREAAAQARREDGADQSGDGEALGAPRPAVS